MGNHVHMLIRALDSTQCKKFYGEVQKRVTDSFKRLLGRQHLSLWEGKPVVAIVLDVEKAMDRIVYFYTNPARANLLESVEDYPGVNTWKAFLSANATLQACSSESVPWIRLPRIRRLKCRTLARWEDERITMQLTRSADEHHELQCRPNAWMKAFGICDDKDVSRINAEIVRRVETEEADLEGARIRRGDGVLGVKRLRKQPILQPHKPKKHGRRIFVLATRADTRKGYIERFRHIVRHCASLYRLACSGEPVSWPPGIFSPPIPPLANLLC